MNLTQTLARYFTSIINYRAAKKQSYIDYFKRIEELKSDPRILQQQIQALSAERASLDEQRKRTEEIRLQGYKDDAQLMDSYQKGLGTVTTAALNASGDRAIAEGQLGVARYGAETERYKADVTREDNKEERQTARATSYQEERDRATTRTASLTGIANEYFNSKQNVINTSAEAIVLLDASKLYLWDENYKERYDTATSDIERAEVLQGYSDAVTNNFNSKILPRLSEVEREKLDDELGAKRPGVRNTTDYVLSSTGVARTNAGQTYSTTLSEERSKYKEQYNENLKPKPEVDVRTGEPLPTYGISRLNVSDVVSQFNQPSFLTRVGVSTTDAQGNTLTGKELETRTTAVLTRAAKNSVYGKHPEWYDEYGMPKEEYAARADKAEADAIQSFVTDQTVAIPEVKYWLDNTNVQREVEIATRSAALDEKEAALNERIKNPKQASIEEIENRATIAYFELHGNKKQKQLIADTKQRLESASRIPGLQAGATDEEIRAVFAGPTLDRALEQAGPQRTERGLEQYADEQRAISRDRRDDRNQYSQISRQELGRTYQTVSEATLDQLVEAGTVERDLETGEYYIPGKGGLDDTYIVTEGDAKPNLRVKPDETTPRVEELIDEQELLRPAPTPSTRIPRAEEMLGEPSSADKALGAGSMGAAARSGAQGISDIGSFAAQPITQSANKYSPEALMQFSGKVYSQLTPQEQKFLDEAALDIAKQFDDAMRLPVSEQRDQKLEDLAISAQILNEVDDVNDKSSMDLEGSVANYMKGMAEGKPSSVYSIAEEQTKKAEKNKLIVPQQAMKEMKAKSAEKGMVVASDVYKSQATAKPAKVENYSTIPKQKLEAIKFIATAPKVPTGKELDNSFAKIFGQEWNNKNIREQAFEMFTAYRMLTE